MLCFQQFIHRTGLWKEQHGAPERLVEALRRLERTSWKLSRATDGDFEDWLAVSGRSAMELGAAVAWTPARVPREEAQVVVRRSRVRRRSRRWRGLRRSGQRPRRLRTRGRERWSSTTRPRHPNGGQLMATCRSSSMRTTSMRRVGGGGGIPNVAPTKGIARGKQPFGKRRAGLLRPCCLVRRQRS